MKKSIVFVLLLCLTMAFVSSVASADPAPPLSDVKIRAFKAENYDDKWKHTPPSYPKNMSAYSFSGPALDMSVIYTGYPDWTLTFIKIGGSRYTHRELLYELRYIYSGGIVTGCEVYYRIPAAKLNASNTISVTSMGSNGGSADDVSTNIRFVK